MRKLLVLSLGFLIFSSISYLLLFTVVPFLSEGRTITSPLPDFLARLTNREVTTLSLWKPDIKAGANYNQIPELTAKSVLVYDVPSGKTLYSKNPNQKLPMASLTKVMTAIIALENPRADNKYYVDKGALVGEATMGLSAGEYLTLEELLYGLILHSGNDAAEVLARNYPEGGRDAFVRAMNDKARALGLFDTNFTNPSGLQGDGDQYTTAYDLLVITRFALDNFPKFREIVATTEYTVPQNGTHKEYVLTNETNLLTTYPGVRGVKIGFTYEAGYCLITLLEYGGHEIIGVLLGSENRRQEMKDLLDYSLTSLGTEPPEYEIP